jgi:hypothetical protein
MHPAFALTCTQCHGGNPKAAAKEEAHVRPSRPLPGDERVLPLDWDPAYLRFRNPANLRAAGEACGGCHQDEIDHLAISLHGTTSGHLSDGLYENGCVKARTDAFSIFKAGPLGVLPAFGAKPARATIAEHYLDLPRKSCMQCHLYSVGRAVRGRLGMDGDYRGEGCAACHVTYAMDGLSRSGDRTINKLEPGHPAKHELTSKIPTATCVHCHYGDASIGLSFRGLAQLVPGMPAGPDNPGTTKVRQNGTFYIQDPGVNPPDIHHEKGMVCIDCHTFRDVMGDGTVYRKMEQAVEIECVDCHGTPERRATLVTSRGTRLAHLRVEADGRVVLRSKGDGRDHEVPQAIDVVTPGTRRYSPRAAMAMTREHARLECYACHAAWEPNFFGFHFDRNEQFTQLDLLTGERTPGRVTTQEKVFATFQNLLIGWNSEGRVAPYMVGFSTMGTVHGKDGKKILDQAMPRTAAGLSGMALVAHQTHTTRPTGRACVECHRNGEALGLGSPNFRLARDFVFLATERGLDAVGLDRTSIEQSAPVSTLPLREARAVALLEDAVEGHARLAVVARQGEVVVADVRSPAFPREVARLKLADPRDVAIEGTKAYIAAGRDGLVIVDLQAPARPRVLSKTPAGDARRLALAGLVAYVLDGAGGNALQTIDVADPAAPRALAAVAFEAEGREPGADDPGAIATWWQWSRPEPKGKGRTVARRVVAAATTTGLLELVDATDPAAPRVLPRPRGPAGRRFDKVSVRSLAYGRIFDLGSEGGGIPSAERDILYVAGEQERGKKDQTYLIALDVTDPEQPRPRGRARLPAEVEGLAVAKVYNAPFVQTFVIAAAQGGGAVVDCSRTDMIQPVARFDGLPRIHGAAVEAIALDRLIDWDGRFEKDLSHPGARYLDRSEILRILRAPIDAPPAVVPARTEPRR